MFLSVSSHTTSVTICSQKRIVQVRDIDISRPELAFSQLLANKTVCTCVYFCYYLERYWMLEIIPSLPRSSIRDFNTFFLFGELGASVTLPFEGFTSASEPIAWIFSTDKVVETSTEAVFCLSSSLPFSSSDFMSRETPASCFCGPDSLELSLPSRRESTFGLLGDAKLITSSYSSSEKSNMTFLFLLSFLGALLKLTSRLSSSLPPLLSAS